MEASDAHSIVWVRALLACYDAGSGARRIKLKGPYILQKNQRRAGGGISSVRANFQLGA
jgi:hypothetical protein